MELEQLRIFIAVAECGSFSGAARKLYISHSTTSRAVSALEEELGLRLFKRDNSIEALSVAGEILLEEAVPLLKAADAIPAKVKAGRQP